MEPELEKLPLRMGQPEAHYPKLDALCHNIVSWAGAICGRTVVLRNHLRAGGEWGRACARQVWGSTWSGVSKVLGWTLTQVWTCRAQWEAKPGEDLLLWAGWTQGAGEGGLSPVQGRALKNPAALAIRVVLLPKKESTSHLRTEP